jgi:hypothetical protein
MPSGPQVIITTVIRQVLVRSLRYLKCEVKRHILKQTQP